MFKSKTLFFGIITILIAITILILDFKDTSFRYHDILVELNGLVFDLLIFGILITIYDTAKEKKDKITRYKEEIDDYRHLENDIASFRVIGAIKRLLDLGVKEIDLSFSYIIRTFETPPTIKKWDFVFSKLFNCKFILRNFDNCSFYSAHFKDVSFGNAVFSNCDFEFAIFEDCYFSDCTFIDKINFNYTYIESEKWLVSLIKENKGLEKVLEHYIISDNTISFENKNFFQLIDKSYNTNTAVDRETLQKQRLIDSEKKRILNAYRFPC